MHATFSRNLELRSKIINRAKKCEFLLVLKPWARFVANDYGVKLCPGVEITSLSHSTLIKHKYINYLQQSKIRILTVAISEAFVMLCFGKSGKTGCHRWTWDGARVRHFIIFYL